MAVYKVIQDVESEDKLLGPLTFKGFIYALITLGCAFVSFELSTGTLAPAIKFALLPLFLLPMILFGVLASPLGRDQPTEVWLLSRLRFYFKTRVRIWDQEGLEELVTVIAPKKAEEHLAKDITQTEVHSRLKTLASTLDTRGWAIKNVDASLNAVTPNNPAIIASSDRLVPNAGYTQAAQVVEVRPSDDILDEQNNPTAQKFASMMQQADSKRRDNIKDLIKSGEDDLPPIDNDFTKKLARARADFSEKHAKKTHNNAVEKSAPKPEAKTRTAPKTTPVTPERQAVNMELAQSGSAFSVATLSKLANRQPQVEQTGPDEITISLH